MAEWTGHSQKRTQAVDFYIFFFKRNRKVLTNSVTLVCDTYHLSKQRHTWEGVSNQNGPRFNRPIKISYVI